MSSKKTRFRGLVRGPRWRDEPPDRLGISRLHVPALLFADIAMGYPLGFPQFAIYRDGDWFDGANEGWADKDMVRTVFAMLPIRRDCELLLVKHPDGRWGMLAEQEDRIGAWLELSCRWPRLDTELPYSKERMLEKIAKERMLDRNGRERLEREIEAVRRKFLMCMQMARMEDE